MQWHGVRTAHICDVFKREVFGDQSSRVRCVLGTQTGRRRADVGVINSGYLLDLQGAHQKVQIRSWSADLRNQPIMFSAPPIPDPNDTFVHLDDASGNTMTRSQII